VPLRSLRRPGEEVEVHVAHELSVLLGEAVERTVKECDLALALFQLVAVAAEDVDHGRPATVAARLDRSSVPRIGPQSSTGVVFQ
jgi:hypothetical protein